MRHASLRRGFTLVELMIVIVILSILVGLTVVYLGTTKDDAKATVLMHDLRTAADQLLLDETKSGKFPDTMAQANGGRGLVASSGTTFSYTVNNSIQPKEFCLAASNASGQQYSITTEGKPVLGACAALPGAPTPPSVTCPANFVIVPGNAIYNTTDFCVMKYEAKNNGAGVPVSQAAGTPWVYVTQMAAASAAKNVCSGCHLITEAEWLTIAANLTSVASNWTGGAVGSGSLYIGHTDAAGIISASTDDADGYNQTGDVAPSKQRRTLRLSTGDVIWDLSGNAWEWTDAQVSGAQPGAPGYAWRDWNTVTNTGKLWPNPWPDFTIPAASGWTAGTHGIGLLYSDSNETGTRGAIRGSSVTALANAGIFTLNIANSPSQSHPRISFRVTK